VNPGLGPHWIANDIVGAFVALPLILIHGLCWLAGLFSGDWKGFRGFTAKLAGVTAAAFAIWVIVNCLAADWLARAQ